MRLKGVTISYKTLAVLIVAALFMFSVAILAGCGSKEPTKEEKERKDNIQKQIENAPAGSFIKWNGGTFIVRDNIDKGRKIFIIMWGGREEISTAEWLAEKNIQAVIPPDDSAWCGVAKEYLPHETTHRKSVATN